MADQDAKPMKKGIATRDFRDAGTEQAFKKGETYDFTQGEFDNHEHAGLVTDANSPSEDEQLRTVLG